jgi:hypothetical protein
MVSRPPHSSLRASSLASLLALVLPLATASAGDLSIRTGKGEGPIHLNGPDDRVQVLVMEGKNLDHSREVTYAIAPAGIAAIGSTGFLIPSGDGKAVLTVTPRGEGAIPVTVPITVENFKHPAPVSFTNDVVPVFTRNHCNAGACHAKAAGQNGFQLSLLGFEAASDFDQIVRHSRGRRVSPAAPANSLLLMKASGDLPHEGGARIKKDSDDYSKILRWIEGGLVFREEGEPTIERIEAFPKNVVTTPGASQQLIVTAFFSDGTTRDITRAAQYEANEPDRATSGETGLVTFAKRTGSTAVLVRFQEKIDTFTAMIPLSGGITAMPPSKNFIDEEIFRQLGTMGIPPSGDAGDGEFLRRVTLDITGRIPTLEETQAFLSANEPDKRAKKIDRLLDSTDYADYFAGKWAGILRNKVDSGVEWITRDSHAFHAWIRSNLIENKPYDQFASDLLLASGKAIENPAVNWYRVVKDSKERMENISQIFLGIRMQCAQCHHHPYEQWSQNDYFALTAFFTTLEKKNIPKLPEEDIYFHREKAALMEHPGTKEKLKPKLLGAEAPVDIPDSQDPRVLLADWMRAKENPYFAKMLVNRYWKHFFSRGLVEPEDDIRPTNPATHPELFDKLAQSFVASGFDMKELIRTICNSHTYQLSSDPNERNGDDEQNYARYYPRRLPAEVLLDSVNDVTGAANAFTRQPQAVRAIALPNERGTLESEFLMMFGRPSMDTACECERTGEANLGQSLHLLNSDTIQAKLTGSTGTAAVLAKAADQTDEDKLTGLYLHAVSRKPNAGELSIALAHLKKKRDLSAADPAALSKEQAEKQAFEDIIWVLLNTKEFMFNR